MRSTIRLFIAGGGAIMLLVILLAPAIVHAQAAQININPHIPGQGDIRTEGPAGFVEGAYNYSLMIGGALAFAVLVYGGILWASARGSTSQVGEAKEWIAGALWGLLLLLGAVVLLNVVNPEILSVGFPSLKPIEPPPIPPGGVDPIPDEDPDGEFDFQGNIEAQLEHASEPLKDLLDCMANTAPGNAGNISSISDSQIVNGENTFEECAAGACDHAANSCHYGGNNCVGESYAVDFGDEQNMITLSNAAAICSNGTAFINPEGNHLHVSIGDANGCDCN